ncbi:MAG: flippase [Lachnospiraceae bacterium]|nr:flippase [Lachnospiraceae bacterium]
MQKFKLGTFAQNVSKIFGVKTLVLILGLFSSIVSARVLGPEGKGIYAVATALTGIGVQFGNLGMHSSNTYFLAKDKKILPAIVGNSMLITLLVTIVTGGVLIVMFLFPDLVTVHGFVLVLAMSFIPLQLYNMFQENYFVALDKIKQYSILEMLNGAVYPILLLVVAFANVETLSPEIAIVLSIFSTGVVLITGWRYLKKEMHEKVCVDRNLLRKTVPFGFKSYVSCLLTYLVLRVDVLMLDSFLNKSETGLYSLAVNLADIVNMIAVSVSMLLFPKLSGMSEKEEKRKFIGKTLKYMAIIMFVLVVGATIFSEMGVLLVYGEAYRPSIPVFKILMPGIFFWALSSLLFNYYSSENRIGVNIVAAFIGLVVNFVLNGFLIPRNGICGAAIASTIAYVIIFIILIICLKKGVDNEKS